MGCSGKQNAGLEGFWLDPAFAVLMSFETIFTYHFFFCIVTCCGLQGQSVKKIIIM